jgi:hypothetical protein
MPSLNLLGGAAVVWGFLAMGVGAAIASDGTGGASQTKRGAVPVARGAVVGRGAGPVASGAAPLAISPQPGTPDASPQTQISILGVAPARIDSVRVSGAVSGLHHGRLMAYSGGRGASFVLGAPLTEGELVHVIVRLRGAAPITFSFGVARPGRVQPLLSAVSVQPAKLDHFITRPDLLAPRITVLKRSPDLTGDVFLTPLPAPTIHPGSNNVLTIRPVGPGGPMIVDGRGRLVWFEQLTPPTVAADFRVQRFGGRDALTWWQGGVTPAAFGIGEGVIADSSYRVRRVVRAGNGYAADIHEFVLTPSGDALFTVYSPVMVHLAGTAPGALSPLLDSLVQEVDVRTGLVVWEWHALGHIPLADSYATPATSATFDAFHLNSIQELPGDRLLVSARDTSAVYEISRGNGRVVWTLGGKASSFRLGPGARFYFQHDAQLLSNQRVSLFDDEAGPPDFARSSRGLILALDERRHTATAVRQYLRPGHDTLADSEGNVQTLTTGEVMLGFGASPFFSQFAPTGRLLFDAALPVDDGSYRTYRFPWNATPTTRPAVVASRRSPACVAVYASWNGATAVARWDVLADGRIVASAPDTGFETRIGVASRATAFAVRALDASGRVLATSSTVPATSSTVPATSSTVPATSSTVPAT